MFTRKKTPGTTLGRQGEDIAAAFLTRNGYTVIARNYRKTFGEVDIVALHGEFLVFIEVKTRQSVRFGSPFEAVDRRKQQQLSKIALDYTVRNNLHDKPARFDVVSVLLQDTKQPLVDIIENAFESCG
ncbi:MAG: YraN family protein [Desulfobulbaceae bacterium]|nr:YraN family protein [Desulfobulbaceae bacterium]